jgi:hypothetical protein
MFTVLGARIILAQNISVTGPFPIRSTISVDSKHLHLPDAIAGGSYVSFKLSYINIYQKQNWYSALMLKDRNVVARATITGTVGGKQYNVTAISQTYPYNKKEGRQSFPFPQLSAIKLPATFPQLDISVEITATGKDASLALTNELNGIARNAQMNGVPGLTVGDAVSTVKTITDTLFNLQLLQQPAVLSLSIATSGPQSFPTGPILAISCDDATQVGGIDFNKFSWDGRRLLYEVDGQSEPAENQPQLKEMSFFVFEITYDAVHFDDPNNAMAYYSYRPWERLIELASEGISSARDIIDLNNTIDSGRQNLAAAYKLILEDEDELILSEKRAIINAAKDRLQNEYNNRYGLLSSVVQSPQVHSKPNPLQDDAPKKVILFDAFDPAGAKPQW